jgi:hypothetical protein
VLIDVKLIKYGLIIYVYVLKDIPKLMEYVCQLMTLLRYAINIKKDPVLEELDECFTSLMLTYIFDISELINQQINNPTDIEKYKDRHDNLIRINKEIEHSKMVLDTVGDDSPYRIEERLNRNSFYGNKNQVADFIISEFNRGINNFIISIANAVYNDISEYEDNSKFMMW